MIFQSLKSTDWSPTPPRPSECKKPCERDQTSCRLTRPFESVPLLSTTILIHVSIGATDTNQPREAYPASSYASWKTQLRPNTFREVSLPLQHVGETSSVGPRYPVPVASMVVAMGTVLFCLWAPAGRPVSVARCSFTTALGSLVWRHHRKS